ncbi:MAG: DUF120 domain-containing protein [Candidatus Micrarchaeota archaeon]
MATIEILILLAKKGAHKRSVRISTTQIGRDLDMSQQNSSRILIELEKSGRINRTASGIDITKKGIEELELLYDTLKAALCGKKSQNEPDGEMITVTGTVANGMGEGAYYVKQYSDRIKKALGFVPFPGTLNIRLDKKSEIEKIKMIGHASRVIEGFEREGRKFGKIYAYSCKIGKEECFVVIPERTHHDESVLEIISRKELRRIFPEGRKVKVRIKLS